MAGKVIRIERTVSRPGGEEIPHLTSRGYQLADPKKGSVKHHSEHAVFVKTLDEAATLLEHGFSLWMTRPGKRPSLIAPGSLRIIRT